MRKCPVGPPTFSEIVRGGYAYIDKSNPVWELAHYARHILMGRPRRFGKPLPTPTLLADGRRVVKVGVGFDMEKPVGDGWVVENKDRQV